MSPTRSASILTIVALAALTDLTACKVRNELSCEAPENTDFPECTGIDATPTCATPSDCAVGTCKLPDGICVECVMDTDCTGATAPVCDTTNNTCGPCTAHDQCASNACDLDTGACLSDVAYVEANGPGDTAGGCTQTEPCSTLDQAIATTAAVIKINDKGPVTFDSEQQITRDVRIVADPGVRLRRINTVGTAVSVTSGQTVTIEDLEIDQTAGDAIVSTGANLTLDRVTLADNNGLGVTATGTGAKLVIRRSIIAANRNGGISTQDATIDISNSLVVANGSGSSAVGGARFTSAAVGSSFRFNTVADNLNDANMAAVRGVNCAGGFSATSNIVTGNALAVGCTFDHSLFDNSTQPLPTGDGNISGDPRFDSTQLSDLRTSRFYRIKDESAAIDKADPDATEPFDIDGDARPRGAQRDIGADEH